MTVCETKRGQKKAETQDNLYVIQQCYPFRRFTVISANHF